MNPQDYWRLINFCHLSGCDFTADVLLCLYLKDYPNGPRPSVAPVQIVRQRKKDSFSRNPFHNEQAH